uniref:von Willebrand factor A domain-containing protein 5A-like isoform X3 n=1 Tax=Myxine glutinosa TaxID=7769 RepID=UPI00359016D1
MFFDNQRCGLLAKVEHERTEVPLKSVDVTVTARGFVADVAAELAYVNNEAQAVEIEYVFPIDAGWSVYRFSAEIDGKVINAELQEKQQAQVTYDDAVTEGRVAFLLQESGAASDVLRCLLGRLGPGVTAQLKFGMVGELQSGEPGSAKFRLPAVLNPRYCPAGTESMNPVKNVPYMLTPTPYSLKFSFTAEWPAGVENVTSNCSLCPLSRQSATSAEASLDSGFLFDRDIELEVMYRDGERPVVIVEPGDPATKEPFMSKPLVMLSFVPGENLKKSIEESKDDSRNDGETGEFIFVVDCSGSMQSYYDDGDNQQTRMESAKVTLVLLLKSLPLGCKFNIISFGSSFTLCFPESTDYCQQSLDEALAHVKVMPNLGGTEILLPLQHVYRQPGCPGFPRQLFILTDGEVGNTRDVIAEVERNAHAHRCFSFGIGAGASTDLVRGMAKAGGGIAEFVSGSDRLQAKVLGALRCALQPVLTDVSISWHLPSTLSAVITPRVPSNIFLTQRTVLYAHLQGEIPQDKWEGDAVLTYKLRGQLKEQSLPFSFGEEERTSGLTLHRLAARSYLSGILYPQPVSDETQKKALSLSLASGIVCRYTAFVGTSTDNAGKVTSDMPLIRIPRVPQMRGGGMPLAMSVMCSSGFAAPAHPCASPPSGFSCFNARRRLSKKTACKSTAEVCEIDGPVPQRAAKCKALQLMDDCVDALALEVKEEEEEEEIHHLASPKGSAELSIVELQRADGSWELNPELALALSCKSPAIQAAKPKDANEPQWATLLVLVWLHSQATDSQDEWGLLAKKAYIWLKKQGANIVNWVAEANKLLNTSVDQKDLQ